MKHVALILSVLMALLAFAMPCYSQEWSVMPLGGDDLFMIRVGYSPAVTPRITIGPEVGWLDGVGEQGEGDAAFAGFFGRYDLVQDRKKVGDFNMPVPVSWYIGGQGNLVFRDGVDPSAGLFTGLMFGSVKVAEGKKIAAAIGVEGQYLLTKDLWKSFAAIDDEWRLLFFVALGLR